MKIFNVRLGLANNSSSTHSIVFLKQPATDDDCYGNSYGWEFFTAASEEAKKDYLALTLFYNLQRMCSNEMAAAIVREWVGVPFSLRKSDYAGIESGPDGYVDHQSVLTFPNNWDGKGINKQFFDEFKRYLLLPNVAILGGNDNTEEDHPLLRGATRWSTNLPTDEHFGNGANDYVAVKDPKGYWILFNRKFGTKVRFSFDPDSVVPEKSSVPELVDVKITDFCPFGCTFCYQDSTLEGKHADEKVIKSLARSLAEMNVFEVALGGGEPTLYPDFIGVLNTFRHQGVVPNFTTKSLHWLRDPNLRIPILEACGSFAYSANSVHEIWDLLALVNEYGVDTGSAKMSVQTVLGVAYGFELDRIFELCDTAGIQLTLLGFKTTGRGKEYDEKTWLTQTLDTIKRTVKENKCPRLALDTLAAAQLIPHLKELKIPHWLYHTREGQFSCYIDAVTLKMGPSSYCEEEEYQKIRFFEDSNAKNLYDLEPLRVELATLYSQF